MTGGISQYGARALEQSSRGVIGGIAPTVEQPGSSPAAFFTFNS